MHRETATIQTLSSINVGQYEFLTGEGVSSDKELLENTAMTKRFECLLLGSQLKNGYCKRSIQAF